MSAHGFVDKTISVTLAEIALTDIVPGDNQIVDGAAYGGSYTAGRLVFPDAGAFEITFVNLNMSTSDSCFVAKGNPIDGIIHLVGDNVMHSAKSRGLSSSSTTPLQLVSNSGATLTVQGDSSSSAGMKGDFDITNIDLIVVTATTPIEVVSRGLTIVGSGSVSVNDAKAAVLACEGGNLEVNLGAGTPDSSAITVTATPEDGYALSAILVNGVASTDSLTTPAAGETLTIQGVFTEA